jgi:hypothetical protein
MKVQDKMIYITGNNKAAGKPPTSNKNQPGKKVTGQGSKQHKTDDKVNILLFHFQGLLSNKV